MRKVRLETGKAKFILRMKALPKLRGQFQSLEVKKMRAKKCKLKKMSN